jgi:uncharacterized membrane protein
MKVLAFISLIVSIAMLLLMYSFYCPMLDAIETTIKQRFLFISTLVLQLYFLFFSIYLTIKFGSIFKFENNE